MKQQQSGMGWTEKNGWWGFFAGKLSQSDLTAILSAVTAWRQRTGRPAVRATMENPLWGEGKKGKQLQEIFNTLTDRQKDAIEKMRNQLIENYGQLITTPHGKKNAAQYVNRLVQTQKPDEWFKQLETGKVNPNIFKVDEEGETDELVEMMQRVGVAGTEKRFENTRKSIQSLNNVLGNIMRKFEQGTMDAETAIEHISSNIAKIEDQIPKMSFDNPYRPDAYGLLDDFKRLKSSIEAQGVRRIEEDEEDEEEDLDLTETERRAVQDVIHQMERDDPPVSGPDTGFEAIDFDDETRPTFDYFARRRAGEAPLAEEEAEPIPDPWQHGEDDPWPDEEMVGPPSGADEMVGPPMRGLPASMETVGPTLQGPNIPRHPMMTPKLEDFIKITGMPAEISLQDFLNGIMDRKEQETGIIDNKDPSDIVDATIVYTRFTPQPSRKQIKKRVSLATLSNLRPYMSTTYAKNWKTMPNFISDAVVSVEGFEMIAQFLDAPMSTNALRIDSIWGEVEQQGKTTTFTLD